VISLILFVVGLLLSALFSGSETGFYRVTRVRLLLDGLGGDSIARSLLWLTNNPALFVATSLVGNNLANYLTSFAVVLGMRDLIAGQDHIAEMLAPVVLSPLIFVYGELLPKQLFFYAPNRLLRQTGPLFLCFAVVFAPISAILWALGRVLQEIVGQTPLRVRLALARHELQEVFQEGQEAGILRPAQRKLAQSLFSLASRPVDEFCTPIARIAPIRLGDSKRDVYRLARRHRATVVPVIESDSRNLVGYVRIVDLYLDRQESVETVRPLLDVPSRESHIAALIRLQTAGEELARVVDGKGKTVGLLYAEKLTTTLF
jgi:putative hemolysin